MREVELVGVSRFSKEALAAHLHAGETSRWPWGATIRYDQGLARVDQRRLIELYHAYGFHSVEVALPELVWLDEDGEDVRLVVRVVENEPTRVRSVRFEWTDGDAWPGHESWPKEAGIRVGDAFELPALSRLREVAASTLRQAGHCVSSAAESAEVDRKGRTADVRLAIRVGRRCVVDRVVIEGLVAVPEPLVRREVESVVGGPHGPASARRAERAAFAMDVFQSAVVLPPKEPAVDGATPLVLQVHERSPERFKVGVGFGFEPTRWEERVTALYTHRNLLGTLLRLDLRTRVGWAQLPAPWAIQNHGPVVGVEPRFEKKGWLEPQIVWSLAPGFDLDIRDGYRFYRVRNRVAATRFMWGFTKLSLAYTTEFFDFFDLEGALAENRTQLGRDFRDPYLLSFTTVDYKVYLTDDLFEPQNGLIWSLAWDMAGGPWSGHFDFNRLTGGVRAYWAVVGRLRLAARAETGYILPYGDAPGAPINMKFMLGGADTVRGWGLGRLSPQVREAAGGRGIPVGGNTMVLGAVEIRQGVAGPLELAVFADVGDVQPGELRVCRKTSDSLRTRLAGHLAAYVLTPSVAVALLRLGRSLRARSRADPPSTPSPEPLIFRQTLSYSVGDWQYAAGTGLRLGTPVGRFRLDFGWRLNRPDRFAEEANWGVHLALGEPF